jgi:hypothetical protein
MIPELRRAYNAAYSDERYRAYQRRLEAEVGCAIEFRVAETPVFLPPDLLDGMLRSAQDILAQLATQEHQRFSLGAVPPEFDVPNCDEHPLFVQVDFAVTRDENSQDGRLGFRLIELQGFPSLYGFQLIQGLELRKLAPGGERLEFLLSGLDPDGYRQVVGEALLGGHSPENVVLLDLDPPTQKTYPDFAVHEKLWGIRAVCPTTIEKRGRQLWYQRDGRWRRILRAYNRVVFEELRQKKVQLPFSYTEPLELEWAGHPNWYFRWSKHSLLWLEHPAVPKALLLSEVDRPPNDLGNWVLKPLFSFSGHGVKVDLAPGDLEAIPAEHRGQTLLMQKVAYAPVIQTADGNTSKCEVRLMFVWRGGAPLPVNTLARLSQGKMMGVDYNKDRTWVGSSSAFWPRRISS